MSEDTRRGGRMAPSRCCNTAVCHRYSSGGSGGVKDLGCEIAKLGCEIAKCCNPAAAIDIGKPWLVPIDTATRCDTLVEDDGVLVTAVWSVQARRLRVQWLQGRISSHFNFDRRQNVHAFRTCKSR